MFPRAREFVTKTIDHGLTPRATLARRGVCTCVQENPHVWTEAPRKCRTREQLWLECQFATAKT